MVWSNYKVQWCCFFSAFHVKCQSYIPYPFLKGNAGLSAAYPFIKRDAGLGAAYLFVKGDAGLGAAYPFTKGDAGLDASYPFIKGDAVADAAYSFVKAVKTPMVYVFCENTCRNFARMFVCFHKNPKREKC